MTLKPGYKQTEFGVIPVEWETHPCSELSERIMVGIVIRPTQYYVRHGVPAFRSANIREDGINDFDLVYISDASNALLAKSQTRTGDVLTVRTGYPGTSAVVRPVHTGCNCIDILITRPSIKLDSEWLAIWINSSFGKEQVLRNQGGLAQKHFNVGDMRNLVVALPSLTEQRAIATALSDVDALLAALDRFIAKKRDLKQAAMQQLLTGHTRLPGFKGKWETKRLGEIAKIQRGASPRPIDSPIWFDENSPIGWVRISDVTRSGMFLHETTQRLSALGVAHSRPVPTGSIIMSICATVGRPVITKIDVCIHDGFVVFDNLQADQLFLYYVLKWIEPDWSKHGQTGSQMNLNTGLITGTPVLLPPIPEQTAIAEVLSYMDAELNALEQRREKTRALKQGMMQELLTGRIRLI